MFSHTPGRVLGTCFSSTAEGCGVSAQIGYGVVWGSFYRGFRKVPGCWDTSMFFVVCCFRVLKQCLFLPRAPAFVFLRLIWGSPLFRFLFVFSNSEQICCYSNMLVPKESDYTRLRQALSPSGTLQGNRLLNPKEGGSRVGILKGTLRNHTLPPTNTEVQKGPFQEQSSLSTVGG